MLRLAKKNIVLEIYTNLFSTYFKVHKNEPSLDDACSVYARDLTLN
jgi:hypothetical protein